MTLCDCRGDCCGENLQFFRITVGRNLCAENAFVPQGLTGDFVCQKEGNTVRIDIPDSRKRTLMICEVEVYNQFSKLQAAQCYSGGRYSGMEACKSCAGPGPSQCLSCHDGNAIIPWRQLDGKYQGHCASITNTINIVEVRGGLQDLFATKYGLMTMTTGFTSRGDNRISARVSCVVHKITHCSEKKANVNNVTQECRVTKRAYLESLPLVEWAYISTDMQNLCKAAGSAEASTSGCKYPTNHTRVFDSMISSDMNDACAVVIYTL